MFWDRRTIADAVLIFGSTLAVYIAVAIIIAHPASAAHPWFGVLIALAGLSLAVASLTFAARRVFQASQLRLAAEERVRKLAQTDALTGLMNRASFEEALSKELLRLAANPHLRSAAIVIDLKGFKPVSDLFGDAVSDELLVQLAERVKPLLPPGGLFARLRNDVFAILLPQITSLDDARGLAKRIMDVLHEPMRAGNAEHLIGAAIGIAIAPTHAQTAGDLLARGGHAMWRARDFGHWAMCLFAPGMEAEIGETSQIERALPAAIGTDALEPHYQAIVDLHTNVVIGFEALARWTHPTLGPISPAKFIAVAEDVGLIRPLTDHLFRKACRDAANWPGEIFLSFNISPKELQNPSLGRALLSILEETRLPPTRLQVELTESAVLRDFQAAREVLATLRTAGVTIALDDFGTGRASLAHLRELKIDALKVDGSFVQLQSRESVMILEAILAIAQRMDLSVTAEGVETEQQRTALLSRGCRRGQGYLFGRPMAANQLATLLAQTDGTLLPAAARPFLLRETR